MYENFVEIVLDYGCASFILIHGPIPEISKNYNNGVQIVGSDSTYIIFHCQSNAQRNCIIRDLLGSYLVFLILTLIHGPKIIIYNINRPK